MQLHTERCPGRLRRSGTGSCSFANSLRFSFMSQEMSSRIFQWASEIEEEYEGLWKIFCPKKSLNITSHSGRRNPTDSSIYEGFRTSYGHHHCTQRILSVSNLWNLYGLSSPAEQLRSFSFYVLLFCFSACVSLHYIASHHAGKPLQSLCPLRCYPHRWSLAATSKGDYRPRLWTFVLRTCNCYISREFLKLYAIYERSIMYFPPILLFLFELAHHVSTALKHRKFRIRASRE